MVAPQVSLNIQLLSDTLQCKHLILNQGGKPSDLTMEEVSNVVSLLKNLMANLNEEDEDGQIVIKNVQNVIHKEYIQL